MRKEVRTRSLVLAIVLALASVIAVYAASPPDQLRPLPPIEEKLVVPTGYSESDSHGAAAYPYVLESANSYPDHGLTFRIGGYGKLDVIHDFDAIGNTDKFDVAAIPTDGRPGENTRLHTRQTILNLDTRMPVGTDDLRIFVEGDFFNGNNTTFRLRHAFAKIGGVTAGQTWSTFMDKGPGPRLVDFENPSGYIVDRRALLRFEHKLTESLLIAAAVEESRIAISEPIGVTGITNSLLPDVVARIRWEQPSFHTQVAAIVRQFQFQEDISGNTQDVTGWGFNFSGTLQVTRCDTAYFEITFGEGIGGFRDVTDAGPDDFGVLKSLPVFAWNVAGTHDWSERWSSNFIFSKGNVTNSTGQAGSEVSSLEYLAANIIWSPHDQIDVGLEYLFGKRQDKDGAAGEANRLHFGIWFYLP